MKLATSIVTVLAFTLVGPVTAAQLPTPTGPVVLQVTGLIANTNDGAVANFDLSMLAALDARATTTTAPWYDGVHTFTGALGSAFLADVGATGTMLRVTALNDYVTEIPLSDFRDYSVVLATAIDGKLLSVRDKGPIFIIYPFDEAPELNNETYYGRSAWQVKSIEVY